MTTQRRDGMTTEHVRERLVDMMLLRLPARWDVSHLKIIADAILAAGFRLVTTPTGNEAVEAARRLSAAMVGEPDHWPLASDVEKCARYILSLALGKDVVEGAHEIANRYFGHITGVTDQPADMLAADIAAFATACVAKERELDCKAADDATLPEGYVWGADALEQFTFGKKRAIAAIRRRTP